MTRERDQTGHRSGAIGGSVHHGRWSANEPDGAGDGDLVATTAERPSRYQLLFQRTVPGFEPSSVSYALAVRELERMRTWLHRAGIPSEEDLDLWRALLLGLAGEQLANDPGGQRWRVLARHAAIFFFAFTHAKENLS